MISAIKSFLPKYHPFATRAAQRAVHQKLMRMDDRLLEDAGISRYLLGQGVDAWPWRHSDQPAPQSVSPSARAAQTVPSSQVVGQAIRELQAYSDAELGDLGLSRGSISDAVRNGRPGIDVGEQRHAA